MKHYTVKAYGGVDSGCNYRLSASYHRPLFLTHIARGRSRNAACHLECGVIFMAVM
jgi:hypothetical protein